MNRSLRKKITKAANFSEPHKTALRSAPGIESMEVEEMQAWLKTGEAFLLLPVSFLGTVFIGSDRSAIHNDKTIGEVAASQASDITRQEKAKDKEKAKTQELWVSHNGSTAPADIERYNEVVKAALAIIATTPKKQAAVA